MRKDGRENELVYQPDFLPFYLPSLFSNRDILTPSEMRTDRKEREGKQEEVGIREKSEILEKMEVQKEKRNYN